MNEKLTKYPNFTYLPEKNIFPNFWGTCPLPPVSHAIYWLEVVCFIRLL